MGRLLLGIDVGTYSSKGVLVEPVGTGAGLPSIQARAGEKTCTRSKGVLVEPDGTVLRTHVAEHGMDIPQPGWAEQDADAVWWSDVVQNCRALLSRDPYHL
jgi:xylulokinase